MRKIRKIRSNAGQERLFLALLVIIIVAVYFSFKSLPSHDKPAKAVTILRAVEVLDGDTFRASNGETIRILGIDTPEAGEPFCDEATAFLMDLLDTNELRLEYDYRKRDKYNRLLAYVFTSENFVNRELIRNGLASVYIFPASMRNFSYRQELIEDQIFARQNKLGIWSLPDPQPENLYIGNTRTFRFHRPDCQSTVNLGSDHSMELNSREEFLDLGYSSCRNCNP